MSYDRAEPQDERENTSIHRHYSSTYNSLLCTRRKALSFSFSFPLYSLFKTPSSSKLLASSLTLGLGFRPLGMAIGTAASDVGLDDPGVSNRVRIDSDRFDSAGYSGGYRGFVRVFGVDDGAWRLTGVCATAEDVEGQEGPAIQTEDPGTGAGVCKFNGGGRLCGDRGIAPGTGRAGDHAGEEGCAG